jgi:hypothetical protein
MSKNFLKLVDFSKLLNYTEYRKLSKTKTNPKERIKMKNQKVAETNAVNVKTGRETKRIGVEVEFFGVNVHEAIEALRAAGLSIASYRGYTHSVLSQWKITYDASVTSTGTGVGNGLELVSPPLTSAEMEKQLKLALEVLNSLGAKVDRTCGIHVHHEIDDLNLDNIKNIYALYGKHQDFINELMPKSRRQEAGPAGQFKGYCQNLSQEELEEVQVANSIQDINSVFSIGYRRYRVINFKSYLKYGTIEFRQHSGSTDFEKVWNWVLITQSLVAQAKAKKTIKPLTEAQSKRALEAFTKEMKIDYTKQALYSRDRRKELKKAEEKRAARIA